MANNYTSSSNFINIPEGKLGEAGGIIEKTKQDISDYDGYCCCEADLRKGDCDTGVWIHDDGETVNPEHME